ncbi:MAG: EVE domain-containing protein [bacterium]
MNYFLGKTEPEHDYSIDDLEREGRTLWDNIHNAQALRVVSDMRPGDQIFIYHSGKQRAVVGLAEIDSDPFPNPDDPTNTWTVNVKFIKKYDHPLPLSAFKAEPALQKFALVHQGRLSTMAVPPEIASWMLERLDRTD